MEEDKVYEVLSNSFVREKNNDTFIILNVKTQLLKNSTLYISSWSSPVMMIIIIIDLCASTEPLSIDFCLWAISTVLKEIARVLAFFFKLPNHSFFHPITGKKNTAARWNIWVSWQNVIGYFMCMSFKNRPHLYIFISLAVVVNILAYLFSFVG